MEMVCVRCLSWLWLEVVVANAWCHLRIPVAYIQSLFVYTFLTNSITHTHTPLRPSFLSIFYLTSRGALNITLRNEINEQKTLLKMTGYMATNLTSIPPYMLRERRGLGTFFGVGLVSFPFAWALPEGTRGA